MAKNNTRKVELSLEKKLRQSQEIYKDKRFLNNLARETAEQIKTRTRLKKGINKSGKNERLKKLSDLYVKQRQGKAKVWTDSATGKVVVVEGKFPKPKLHPDAGPKKSNLTATGQLLDSLRGRYRRKSIEIDFKKERRGPDIFGKTGKATNSDIVGYQEDQGRRFFDLSNSELNGLRRKIANRIRKLLEK